MQTPEEQKSWLCRLPGRCSTAGETALADVRKRPVYMLQCSSGHFAPRPDAKCVAGAGT